jgi:hypothetical protein
MAGDSTISGLNSGTTPTGAELVPVVQAGNTVKITAAQIAALATLGAVPNYDDFVAPAGAINGANVTFTLPNAPNPASSSWGVLRNHGIGAFLPCIRGYDYTLSGVTITMTVAPPTGSQLLFSCRH